MRQFTFCMEIEAATLHGWRVNKAVLTVRPVWVTNRRRSAVIAKLGSSLRILELLSVARNKEACPISYHIPCSSWYHHMVQFFRLQKLNRKIAYCCIRRCSPVILASSAVYALSRITYLAVRGIHIISSSKNKPENRVLLYTLIFARAFGIFCCFCLISCHRPGSSWYTYHFIFKN